MKLSAIQINLADRYGITVSGDKGYKVGEKVFNSYLSAFENWQAALNWARENVHKDYIPSAGRDANPILVTVTDRYNVKYRVNKNALDDPNRTIIPIYNRNGVKITDSKTYDPKRDAGSTHIHKGNIVGTPEFDEDTKAYNELIAKLEAEEAAPAAEVETIIIDRPEYEPHPDAPLYRWSNADQKYILGHKPPQDDIKSGKYQTVKGEGAPQYTFFAGKDVQLSFEF